MQTMDLISSIVNMTVLTCWFLQVSAPSSWACAAHFPKEGRLKRETSPLKPVSIHQVNLGQRLVLISVVYFTVTSSILCQP